MASIGNQLKMAGFPTYLIGAAIKSGFSFDEIMQIKAVEGAGLNEGSFKSEEADVTLLDTPRPFPVWGRSGIDFKTMAQMNTAMSLPVAIAGALMPDAHVGYGLPIGGVLATENQVIPWAVGVDIGCRMEMSIYGISPDQLKVSSIFREALEQETHFGGRDWGVRRKHPILGNSGWETTPFLRSLKGLASIQLGTSGAGNHFVEWGEIDLVQPLGELSPGRYLALMSHGGSRKPGKEIADYYSKVAASHFSKSFNKSTNMAWLDLNDEDGQEYWMAMNLACEFSRANHEIIHEKVSEHVGLEPIQQITNLHNFAEQVTIGGRRMIVHRKGATPAGKNQLGVIPGSMADPAYLVYGLGVEASLNSASHGAGRAMSRSQAKATIRPEDMQAYLDLNEVKLVGTGALDEAPMAYKNIDDVMREQADLVMPIGRFLPRLVRMEGKESDD